MNEVVLQLIGYIIYGLVFLAFSSYFTAKWHKMKFWKVYLSCLGITVVVFGIAILINVYLLYYK